MRLSFFPLRLTTVGAIAICIAVVTRLQTADTFGWAPVRWTSVSALPRETLFLTGPLACIVAAWVARVNETVITGCAPGRSWASIMRRHLSVVGLAVTVGYVLGLTPAFIEANRRATDGGPDVLVIVSGLAGLLVFLMTGYVLGSRYAAPSGVVLAAAAGFMLSGGLMFLSDLMTSAGVPLSLFSVIPFWTFPLSRGSHEAAEIAAFRALFLAGVAVSLAVALPRFLDLRLARPSVRLVQAGKALLPVLALGVIALTTQPHIALPDEKPNVTCRGTDHGPLCVYAEEEAILDDSAQIVDNTIDQFGPGALTGRFTSVRSNQLVDPIEPGILVFTPQVEYDEAWFVDALTYDVARGISGVNDCGVMLHNRYGQNYFNDAPLAYRDAEMFGQILAAELARRAGVQTQETFVLPSDEETQQWSGTRRLTGTLEGATDTELRAWLSAHATDLRTCAVVPKDLKL